MLRVRVGVSWYRTGKKSWGRPTKIEHMSDLEQRVWDLRDLLAAMVDALGAALPMTPEVLEACQAIAEWDVEPPEQVGP